VTLDQSTIQFVVAVSGTLVGLGTGLFVAGRKRGAQEARTMTKEECAAAREHDAAHIEKVVEMITALTRQVDRMAGAMERNGYHLGRQASEN